MIADTGPSSGLRRLLLFVVERTNSFLNGHWPRLSLPVGGCFSSCHFYPGTGHGAIHDLPGFEEVPGRGHSGWVSCAPCPSFNDHVSDSVLGAAEEQEGPRCMKGSRSCSWGGLHDLAWVPVRGTEAEEELFAGPLFFVEAHIRGGVVRPTLRLCKRQF